jgi:hypothetical protein
MAQVLCTSSMVTLTTPVVPILALLQVASHHVPTGVPDFVARRDMM